MILIWVVLGLLVSLMVSALGLLLATAVVVRLPANYFSQSRSRAFWMNAHPVLRWTGLIIKNIVGAALVVVGIVLTLPGIPGPGLLTILFGIMLMDFPGKLRLERWLIKRPKVLAALNRLRRRYGKLPFVLEEA